MMKLLSLDSPVMRFLSKAADLMLLNALFLICSLPVITIGASLTALFTATMKLSKNEEGYLITTFFKSFKRNFRQSTTAWLIFLSIGTIAAVDFLAVPSSFPYLGSVLHFLLGTVVLLALLTAAYVFPCLARFEGSLNIIMKNSILIATVNLPVTLALFALPVMSVVISMFFGLSSACLYFTLCGFSLNAFAASFLLQNVFAKYEPE